jgi:hypothetical protein
MGGNMYPRRTPCATFSLPLKGNLDRLYAAREARRTVMKVAPTATNKLFRRYKVIGVVFHVTI